KSGFDCGITTIALIHGNALGGGFECALSNHVIVAERNVEIGLPEVIFNLFPGMGAFQFLSQRLNPVMAERMILSGRMYSAEELFDMGVVDILAEEGGGEESVLSYIKSSRRHRNSHIALTRVRQRVAPVDYDELLDICDIWVETALDLPDKDKRTMRRLVRSQSRFSDDKSSISLKQLQAS
ncbi:MAG: enoyl-CoA hydratase/isomerase family protein, partial [Proteobacteria bacterium]|nr:enoyl-CoA hydratase/isomerase family protein [Pseudomonadota bacterium]